MTETIKQIIKEEVGKIPKEAQEVINNFGWENIIEEIGKKYLLAENEMSNLQIETLLVLVGIERADFYVENIERQVGTSKNEAEKITTEVFEKIFAPLANILEENIKNNLGTKGITWQQNLDFILSGGNYTVFIEKRRDEKSAQNTDKILGSSNILETKDRLLN